MDICVLGLRRFGLTSAIMMAKQGYFVTGIDSDAGMIDLLNVWKLRLMS